MGNETACATCIHPGIALAPGAPAGRCLRCRATIDVRDVEAAWKQLEADRLLSRLRPDAPVGVH